MSDLHNELEDLRGEQRTFLTATDLWVTSVCQTLNGAERADLRAAIREAVEEAYAARFMTLQDEIHVIQTGGY